MKKILAVILSFTCLFSSFAFLTSAEENTVTNTETSTDESTEESTGHVHEPNSYLVDYTETTHGYLCSNCNESYFEDHIPEEEGKCPCGYFDHEHKPEAWFMPGMYTEETGTAHSYLCSECSNAAVITEEHTFDENGNCPCGMVDPEKITENRDIMSILRILFTIIPQYFNFGMKILGKAFDVFADEMDSYLYYYKVLAYLIAFGI